MQVTKNCLSYDQTELDYQAMLTTAEVAFTLLRESINRYLQKLNEYPLSECFYLTTAHLAGDAKCLNIVAETLHTLREGLDRYELRVVNKPEIEEVN